MPDVSPLEPTPEATDAVSLATGIALFNQGQYYDCHDVLEALWMEAEAVEKPFYQGILQIAVGLYHLGNRNWRGASILLGEGVNRLRPFEPSYGGVAVADLVDMGWAWLVALQQTGIERVDDMALALAQAQQSTTSQSITLAEGPLTLPVPTIGFGETPGGAFHPS